MLAQFRGAGALLHLEIFHNLILQGLLARGGMNLKILHFYRLLHHFDDFDLLLHGLFELGRLHFFYDELLLRVLGLLSHCDELEHQCLGFLLLGYQLFL